MDSTKIRSTNSCTVGISLIIPHDCPMNCTPRSTSPSTVMKPSMYEKFIDCVKDKGGTPVTNVADYTLCHHLPGWYETCSDLTAITKFGSEDNVAAIAQELGWNSFFVKDFVKSNNSMKGSIAKSPDEVCAIVKELKKFRGDIEGGIALRRILHARV